jgi:hypothetical protein
MLPATNCPREFTVGVSIETLGTSRLIASRSSTVNVFVPVSPVPLRTPPTFCAPALTNKRFVPMLSIWAATAACAPWPILTIATTAETPMMMPSIVNAARILLRCRARKATRMIIKRFINTFESYPQITQKAFKGKTIFLICVICVICGLLIFFFIIFNHRQILQLFRRVALIFNLVIFPDLAILEHDHAFRVLRDVRLVCHQDQSNSPFAIQALKDLHHLNCGARI